MIAQLLNIKHNCPHLWNAVERVNGSLFCFRRRGMEDRAESLIAAGSPEGFAFSLVEPDDIPELSAFLQAQPQESLEYFRPHLFDRDTLTRLHRNPSFLMMKATETASGRIVGYFFLRCFFVGAAFAGLIVDGDYRNRGLGTCMWATCMSVCRREKMRMFATISGQNVPSLRSCRKGTDMKVKKRITKDYLFIESKSKNNN